MVSTFAYAAAALWGCVNLFLREETLFRGPEGGTAFFTRPAPRERPGGAAALFLFAACMALIWYGQSWLPKDVVRNVLATQFLVILAPCLALTLWVRAEPSATFRLSRARPTWLLGAAAIGIAAPVLNLALAQVIERATGPSAPSEMLRQFAAELEAFVHSNLVGATLLIAVLPAVCEEIFFRGFVLSGLASAFRGRGASLRAVVLTSALFALFHLAPEKWCPTFLTGLALGFLAVRTGSIWPGMLAHAVNNSFLVLCGDALAEGADAPLVAAAATLLVLGVAVVLATSRVRSPAADAPPVST
jgi:sodium transport system permease protein